MAVLGLIMLIAAGVLTAAVVTSNTGAIETDLWGMTISNLSVGAVFVTGMLVTVVGVVGILLLMAGARHNRRMRHERRVLRRENERLAQQVSGPPTDTAPSDREWEHPAEPAGRTTSAGEPADTGATAGPAHSAEGRTRRFDRGTGERSAPATAEERPTEGGIGPMGASRERARTGDSGT